MIGSTELSTAIAAYETGLEGSDQLLLAVAKAVVSIIDRLERLDVLVRNIGNTGPLGSPYGNTGPLGSPYRDPS